MFHEEENSHFPFTAKNMAYHMAQKRISLTALYNKDEYLFTSKINELALPHQIPK